MIGANVDLRTLSNLNFVAADFKEGSEITKIIGKAVDESLKSFDLQPNDIDSLCMLLVSMKTTDNIGSETLLNLITRFQSLVSKVPIGRLSSKLYMTLSKVVD